MTDLRKVAEIALEALNQATGMCAERTSTRKDIDEAITALRQALEQPDPFSRLVRIMGTFDLSTGHADNWNDLLDSLESELRDVLGYYRETFKVEQECSTHPDAPHGFNRDASHGLGRYVCDCEGWEPPTVSQEPQTMPEKTDDVAQETQPEQEPVAWNWMQEDNPCSPVYYGKPPDADIQEVASRNGKTVRLLYTAPQPSKPWVGLTHEERYLNDCRSEEEIEYARAIEAKLKEKNHG